MDEAIFFDYIETIFIPYICSLRASKHSFKKENAVLLMDSCPAHTSNRILQILGENSIMVITFPAHRTNLFQSLDLVLFGIVKKKKQTEDCEPDQIAILQQISRLLNAYESAATSTNIRSSFKKAGFLIDTTSSLSRVKFDDNIVRGNPGFRELWERNFSINNISTRQRNSSFGFINEQYFIDLSIE
jgi:hypothetical protein